MCATVIIALLSSPLIPSPSPLGFHPNLSFALLKAKEKALKKNLKKQSTCLCLGFKTIAIWIMNEIFLIQKLKPFFSQTLAVLLSMLLWGGVQCICGLYMVLLILLILRKLPFVFFCVCKFLTYKYVTYLCYWCLPSICVWFFLMYLCFYRNSQQLNPQAKGSSKVVYKIFMRPEVWVSVLSPIGVIPVCNVLLVVFSRFPLCSVLWNHFKTERLGPPEFL